MVVQQLKMRGLRVLNLLSSSSGVQRTRRPVSLGRLFRTPLDAYDYYGFHARQANIAGDFRGTGVLALKGMVFFCEHYDRKASVLVERETLTQPSTLLERFYLFSEYLVPG